MNPPDQCDNAAILDAINAAAPHPLGMARAALEVHYTANEDPRVARITHLEILGVNDDIDRSYRTSMQRFATIIGGVLLRVDDSTIGTAQRQLMATGLVGAAVQITTHGLLGGYRHSRDAVIGGALALFSAVLAQHLTKPPSGR